jgi:phytoene synthase
MRFAPVRNRFKEIFKKGSTTYFNSSLLFPEDIRKKVYRLYAFVRVADDYVDAIPQQKEKYFAFKDDYYRALQGETVNNDVINSFVALSEELNFPAEWTEAFFTSMEMDINNHIYETFADTEKYIYGSASVIGLYMACVLNLPTESYPAAEDLGKAFQYINFIRDIKEDLDLNRCYFPQTELQRYGLNNVEESTARSKPEAFTNFAKDQIERYYGWQKAGEAGFVFMPKKYLIAVKTASEMYKWTAKQIYKDPFIVYSKKVKPSRLKIFLQALKVSVF